jgi:hypothetical protein
MKIWQPLLSVPNFQISRGEILYNKPIIFVRKRAKTHPQQCRISKFSAEDHGERMGGREEWKREEGWREEGKGWGRRKGMCRTEGLKEREGREREEKGGGMGEDLDPDIPD